MEDQNPVIEINDLHRSYGKVDAVNGLNLNVPPGRCYGLFGRNGAGKTTTLHCMLNLLRPKRGEIKLFGLCPRRDEVSVKSRLAWVPDSAAFYPWMKIGGHFRYVASLRGVHGANGNPGYGVRLGGINFGFLDWRDDTHVCRIHRFCVSEKAVLARRIADILLGRAATRI